MSYYQDLLKRVAELNSQKKNAQTIAHILNEEGWRPAKRRGTFNAYMEHTSLSRQRLRSSRKKRPSDAIAKRANEWTIRELSLKLEIPEPTLYSWHDRENRLTIEVNRHLEMVGLSAFKDYLPKEISGGMKQRVALARVLILKPKVLLMDEPFGALDAQTREEMQNLLLSLWQELSHTIVFVTHDLGEALTLADRILVMDRNPSRIQSEIQVTLPRPRKKESDAFHRFYRDLRSRLKG